MKPYRIIISGGGTGGHIFPAIAIANSFKKRFPNTEILFVGADNRMEMERVPAAGYPIVGLPVSGFNRKSLLKNIEVLKQLKQSLHLAKKTIKEYQPDIVIGVGGYASGPTLWEAARMGIPTMLQEQNSYAGVTNKLLARKAIKICVAYDGMEKFFSAKKIVFTGNPVREGLEHALRKKTEALSYFGFVPEKKTLLIVGGSLGARTINKSVLNSLEKLIHSDIQVIWQTGKHYVAEASEALAGKEGADIWHSDFITRMDYAYSAADLVISRAGAGSISEICLLKKPVILVPSPNVAEDHQTRNAQALVKKGAALMVKDSDAVEQLINTALDIIWDDKRLHAMSEKIAPLAQYGSAERIVNEALKILENKNGTK
ncbi:undecaprenyldiphospho-muramoylpentapeptide beta-N-acetylglucosaminyltransferase [Parabacteroides sp. OttesenSCG-928-N08]|nr:undecaprenyldiphospho-muramoylpentapeptide beta-N-acetylglucosaminyltransferase [Parabacteroides sp. OttesenSCG-928-N08]